MILYLILRFHRQTVFSAIWGRIRFTIDSMWMESMNFLRLYHKRKSDKTKGHWSCLLSLPFSASTQSMVCLNIQLTIFDLLRWNLSILSNVRENAKRRKNSNYMSNAKIKISKVSEDDDLSKYWFFSISIAVITSEVKCCFLLWLERHLEVAASWLMDHDTTSTSKEEMGLCGWWHVRLVF
jgi:hypothetical protein